VSTPAGGAAAFVILLILGVATGCCIIQTRRRFAYGKYSQKQEVGIGESHDLTYDDDVPVQEREVTGEGEDYDEGGRTHVAPRSSRQVDFEIGQDDEEPLDERAAERRAAEKRGENDHQLDVI